MTKIPLHRVISELELRFAEYERMMLAFPGQIAPADLIEQARIRGVIQFEIDKVRAMFDEKIDELRAKAKEPE